MPGSEEKESEGWCGEAAAEVEALAAGEVEPAGGGRVLAQAPARHPLLLYTPAEYMDKQLKGQLREVLAQAPASHPLLLYTPTGTNT